MDLHTQRVIFWIDEHHYSRQHWEVVAQDIYVKHEKNVERATEELAKAIEGFHHQFQDAVVKPGNVLHEFIEMSLAKVDWVAVAKTRYKHYE